MRLSRRTLLATGCAAPLASLLPDQADAAQAAAGAVSRALFEPLVGSRFVMRDAGGARLATLTAVRGLPRGGGDGCFALEFALHDGARAEQATFDVLHPALPRFAALAAPSDATGGRLVAVFNSPA